MQDLMEWFASLPKRPQMGHDIDLEKQISKRSEANMKQDNKKGDVKVLGIDLAKTSYQLHGEADSGQTVVNKKFNRKNLTAFVARLPPCIIGLEACGGAHYWARVFKAFGHEVKIMAPQFVKPFVKSNKNDAIDAQAICEAVQRPSMRFVPEKSVEQQDIQSLHRIRSQLISRRTAQSNQIRGLLLEYGIVIPKGISYVRKQIPWVLEDGESGLSSLFREALGELYQELVHLDQRVTTLEKKLQRISDQNEDCQRLLTIPGIGLLSATALVSAIGNINAFKSGRELAAWMGLVPRQHSTGGKPTLLGISKRGDTYLRTLLIHGGRSVVRFAHKYKDRRNQWVSRMEKRRGKNITAVAVANKNARVVWALLSQQTDYRLQAIDS